MRSILYIVAVVLFALAGFAGGIDTSAGDLVAFGLAFFAAGHAAEPYWPARA